MAIIKGWMDDSLREDVWAVGKPCRGRPSVGIFPTAIGRSCWRSMECHISIRGRWANRSGPFAKWLPPQQHQQKVAEFFGDLASVIGTCRLVAFALLVRLNDLKKFNSKYNLRLQPYPLAAYGCMLMVAKEHENLTCELFLITWKR